MNLWYTFEVTIRKPSSNRMNYVKKLRSSAQLSDINTTEYRRGVSAEMLMQLSRLFHVSADYILNGDSPDNLDPIVNEAIEILNNLKTDKAKQSALVMLRQIQILEG